NNLIVNPDFSIIFSDSPNNKLDISAHLIDSSPPTIDSNIYPDKGLLGSFALNDLKVDQGAGGTSQTNPSSFINNNGNGLVVWRDTRASTISLYARFFNDYLPDGKDFSITSKSNPSGDIFNSNVNLTNSGNGFVVWAESIPDPVTYASHIYLQQMKSYITFSNKIPIDGSLIGNQQNQSQPKVSLSSSDGRGAIVWHGDSDPTIAVNNDIYIRSLTSLPTDDWSSYKLGGSSATPTKIINSSLPFDQTDASISKINSSGSCFVVWQDNRSGNYDIYGRKVTIESDGSISFDTESIINQGTTNNQEKPSIALDDNGNGLIVWQDNRFGNYDIYGRKISRYSLSTSNPEFIISNASGDKKLPNVKLDSKGDGIVTWDDAGTSRTPVVSGTDIYAKKIKSYAPIGNDYKVDNDTTLAQSNNSLSINDSGNGFISWQDLRDSSDVNIYGRRVINNKTQ
ncbi:MAG: hypothetical protein H7263_14105, partial [Candidatus Sericytochromatia bacterium]|nr:hypothetical protein [Candidatus Sericytochromatia bacterium]